MSYPSELIIAIKTFEYDKHELGTDFDNYEKYTELADLPTHGFAEVELKDGTILVFTTSEWSNILVKNKAT